MSTPKLSPEIIVDDGLLAEAIDAFVDTSPVLKLRERSLRGREAAMKAALEDDHWIAALALDDARVEHLHALLVEVVRWAYREGFKRGAST